MTTRQCVKVAELRKIGYQTLVDWLKIQTTFMSEERLHMWKALRNTFFVIHFQLKSSESMIVWNSTTFILRIF